LGKRAGILKKITQGLPKRILEEISKGIMMEGQQGHLAKKFERNRGEIRERNP